MVGVAPTGRSVCKCTSYREEDQTKRVRTCLESGDILLKSVLTTLKGCFGIKIWFKAVGYNLVRVSQLVMMVACTVSTQR